jgi:predicted nuclease of restriction endonuclease-like RecB superfamily
MLPTELLMFRVKAGLVEPKRLKPTPGNLLLAETLIRTFETHLGKRRFELDDDLKTLEAGRTDFKVVRGLAHLLTNSASTFEAGGHAEPHLVREKVFELAQGQPPSRIRRELVLEQAAAALSTETKLSAADVAAALYADLSDQQTLIAFDPPEPLDLIHRFDLAQAQGVLYRAYSLIITARPNEPARYKQLLKYTKFFGLMLTVEGDPTYGFTLTLDGPTSLFSGTTRYGLSMAKFLPALLHVTKWDLTATLKPRRDLSWVDPKDEEWNYGLTSEDGYVSHYKPPEDHDSALESGFADRFSKLDTPWRLEREVDLVPVPGGVILPDFRLVHEDGRSILVEIVGYWRPEYLKKKFDLLRKSGRRDVIVAVSERLNLERAGVDVADFDERLIWFKGILAPKDVLVVAERLTGEAAPA